MSDYFLHNYVKSFLIQTSQNAYIAGNEDISSSCAVFLDFYRYVVDGKSCTIFDEILAYNNLCSSLKNSLGECVAPNILNSETHKEIATTKYNVLHFIIKSITLFSQNHIVNDAIFEIQDGVQTLTLFYDDFFEVFRNEEKDEYSNC